MPKGTKGFQKGVKQDFSSPRSWGKKWKLNEEQKKKRKEIGIGFQKGIDRSGDKNPRWIDGLSQWKRIVKTQEKIAGRRKPEICEICDFPGRICFDHCHKTGEFRGWLCNKCNSILGLSGDDPIILKKLIKYLKKEDL